MTVREAWFVLGFVSAGGFYLVVLWLWARGVRRAIGVPRDMTPAERRLWTAAMEREYGGRP